MSTRRASVLSGQVPAPEVRKLRRHLLALATGLVLVSGVLVALALAEQRTQELESGHRLNESLTRVVEAQVISAVQAVDQRLQLTAQGLALLEAVGQSSDSSIRALLREQSEALPFVRSIWWIDSRGRVLHAPDAGAVGLQVADREFFQAYLRDPHTGFHLSAPVRSRVTGLWLISAARPLRSANGAFAGVLVAGLDPPYFDRLWQAMDLGPDSAVALLRRDGTLLMRSPWLESALGHTFDSSALFSQRLAQQANGRYLGPSPVDGRQRLNAYRSLAGPPQLLVLVARSADTVLAPWRRAVLLAGSIWAVASAVVGLLFVALERAWHQRLLADAEARLMAERLTLATDAAGIGVWDWDLQNDRWQASPTWYTLLGLVPDPGPGDRQRAIDTVHPDDRAAVAAKIQAMLDGADLPYGYEARMRHADGSLRWVQVTGRVMARGATGKPTRLLGTRIDITERHLGDAALRRSLAEQGALLKEVHHRVKNNLQIVHSLLRLEAGRSLQPETTRVLHDMRARIQAMALLHESIYRTSSFAGVDLGDYLRQVATQAVRAHQTQAAAVRLQLDLVSTRIALDQALPCGLLVSELISNSLKHGFAGGGGGEIQVALRWLGGGAALQLCIRDNGSGLPADFEARRGQSLGLQLVADLAQQLGGRLDIGPAPAAVFTVTFVPAGTQVEAHPR
jgi:PAS domain S-box-containing protein